MSMPDNFDPVSDAVDEVNIPKDKVRDENPQPDADKNKTLFQLCREACDNLENLIREQHEKQTMDFNINTRKAFHAQMGFREAMKNLKLIPLNTLTDPRFERLLQTLGVGGVVGDTFVMGCAFSDKNVLPETLAGNSDTKDAVYSSECVVDKPHCALDNDMLSGRDEMCLEKDKEANFPKEQHEKQTNEFNTNMCKTVFAGFVFNLFVVLAAIPPTNGLQINTTSTTNPPAPTATSSNGETIQKILGGVSAVIAALASLLGLFFHVRRKRHHRHHTRHDPEANVHIDGAGISGSRSSAGESQTEERFELKDFPARHHRHHTRHDPEANVHRDGAGISGSRSSAGEGQTEEKMDHDLEGSVAIDDEGTSTSSRSSASESQSCQTEE